MASQREKEMGRVEVEIEATNWLDEQLVRRGLLQASAVRSARLKALVDTGATMLVLPEPLVKQLGLVAIRKARSQIADGPVVERDVYGGLRLKVLTRWALVEALGGPPNVPALLGQFPLELLDLLVDPKSRKLILNPASPDPEMATVDLY